MLFIYYKLINNTYRIKLLEAQMSKQLLFVQNHVGLDAASTYRDFSEPRWSNVPCVSVENRFPERFLRNKSIMIIEPILRQVTRETKKPLSSITLCLKVTRYYYDTAIVHKTVRIII